MWCILYACTMFGGFVITMYVLQVRFCLLVWIMMFVGWGGVLWDWIVFDCIVYGYLLV